MKKQDKVMLSREFKFRAWYSHLNKRLYFSLSQLSEGDASSKRVHLSRRCQYTGLKDKNGVEIYESDIVEHIGWKTREGKKVFEVVEYGMQHFRENCCMGYDLDDGEYIVIGNIFENPHLLETT